MADDDVRTFLEQLAERLDHGAQAYGNQSPAKPVAATAAALMLEQLDQVGWLFVLWCQAARKAGYARDQASLRQHFLTQLEHRIRRNDRRTGMDRAVSPTCCMAELEVLAVDLFLQHAELRRRLLPIARAIEVAQAIQPDVYRGRRGSVRDPRSDD